MDSLGLVSSGISMVLPRRIAPAAFLFWSFCLFATSAAPNFDRDIQPFLETHCVRCHNEDKQKGDFRIDTLSREVGLKDTPQWGEVMDQISSGEMPPDDEDILPTAEEGAQILEWLSARIKEGEAARMAERARISFHRLSRDEYVHTVYDLLGVHYNATDPGGFTDDPEWHGFERIGSVLSLSAGHIEKYFKAAETILAEAYPEEEPEFFELHKRSVDPEKQVQEPYKTQLREKGLLEKIRFDLWPEDKHRYSGPGRLPSAGVYEVTFQLSGLQPEGGRAPRLMVYHEGLDRVLFEQDVVAPEDQPTKVSFQTHLPEGNQKIMVINNVPGPSNLPRSGRHGRKPFISIADGRIPWQLKLTDEEGKPLYPFLILDSVAWKGPIVTSEQRQRRADYLPKNEGDHEEVRERLSLLAERAFRRPLHPGEIDPYVAIVEAEIEAGEDFHSAIKAGMLSILCSKSFLFLVEGSEDEDRHQLNDWEIASRLSYFLWSTMPDSTLLDLAEKGHLNEKQVLLSQVERMLADPKAERFATSFSTQWLRLKKVGSFPPDQKLYPDYDSHLEASMVGETTAFFREVLQQKLTLREFLDSNWTMVNPRLAMHYDVSVAATDQFQRVALQPEHRRGGLLTQASILSLTSDGTRHRPVHRGVWLSEVIFGKTPPPPPPNVEAIEPNPIDSPKATLRMKLEAHVADPNCASCHRNIDPLGLAFDNYDAIGKWRTREVVQNGVGEDPLVDASGELPDGRKFANADEFKQLLMEDLDAFNAAFIEKLAIYGMRRSLTIDDRDEVLAIAEQSKKQDYRLHDIVTAFVTSDLFQQR